MARRKPTESWRNAIVRYADEPPESLIANPMNWRQHPQSQTQALVGSLNEVGWIAPVIVNETTQHVVDGHARIGEAIARGEPTVPVAYVNLTEEQERLALATFDPIAAMAGTDQKMLDDLLAGISAPDGLEELLASLTTPEQKELGPDDADLTPPTEPITKPGDLWLLGEHRLLCGDAMVAADAEWLLAGAKPALMLTDPPYNASDHQDGTASVDFGHWDRGFDIAQWWQCWVPQLSRTNSAYVFGHHRTLALLWVLWDTDEAYTGVVCWEKPSARPTPFGAGWTWVTELIAFRYAKGHQFHAPIGGIRNYLRENSPRGDEREHPTQKPVGVLTQLIEVSSSAGDVVCDPFIGAGSTLIAAEQLGRRCYAMEIEPAYVDVAVRRWEHVTGKKAQRAS